MIQVVKFFCFASFSHMSMRKTYAQVCVSQIGSEQNCSVARRQTICKLPSIKTAKRLDIPNDPTICSYAESILSTNQRNQPINGKKVSKQYNTHTSDTQRGGWRQGRSPLNPAAPPSGRRAVWGKPTTNTNTLLGAPGIAANPALSWAKLG